MDGTFEEELKAEVEALRLFRARLDERRADQDRSERFDDVAIQDLDPSQIRVLISMRFETARLRNRLAEAERRIADLEQAFGRAG